MTGVPKATVQRIASNQRSLRMDTLEHIISFIIAVMAGVACHIICKWLDSGDNDN